MVTRAFTIFLAEDDEDLRALLAAALRGDGHAVVEAKDGAELMRLLSDALEDARKAPDVVIMDVLMPFCSGLGVLTALRRVQWNLPVVVMTALRHESMHDYARRLGAAAVFAKPFDVDDLRTALLNLQRVHVRATRRAQTGSLRANPPSSRPSSPPPSSAGR